jgi:hypothetical protein
MIRRLFSGILILAVGSVFVGFLCSGCAETPVSVISHIQKDSLATRYEPSGFFGGYKSEKTAEDTYRVSFAYNFYTSDAEAKGYLLYRCAEITMQNNMNYFVVQRRKNYLVPCKIEYVIQIMQDKPVVSEGVYDAQEVSQELRDWVYK